MYAALCEKIRRSAKTSSPLTPTHSVLCCCVLLKLGLLLAGWIPGTGRFAVKYFPSRGHCDATVPSSENGKGKNFLR
jgi:hypothetical protein